MFDEANIQEEARVVHKRQVLLSKRRRTEEETPVHCNTIAIDKLVASPKAGGSAGQSAPGKKLTSRQELVKAAYRKDPHPPKVQQQV